MILKALFHRYFRHPVKPCNHLQYALIKDLSMSEQKLILLFKVNFQIILLKFLLSYSVFFLSPFISVYASWRNLLVISSTEKHIWYQKNLNIGTHEWNCFSLLLNFLKGISFLYVVIKRRVKYFFPAVSKLFHQVDHKWLKPIVT